jgi:glycogen operon protein
MTMDLSKSKCFPLGPTVYEDGVNFSVFSKSAALVELVLFEHVDDAVPACVIRLDPGRDRTYHYWHVFIPGLVPGQIYGYRVHGPFEPDRGLRFDPGKVLLDPYGKVVAVPDGYSRKAASEPGDNAASAMKSVVADLDDYDWEGDTLLMCPFSATVIYEAHVAGLTKNPNSGVAADKRGTYAGLIEKIPYLKALGVTAVELLPVFQFDEQDAPAGRTNYWGYAPVSFFAPHGRYSSRKDFLGPLCEFRDMVKALHRAGLEVILDVVYNHTAEGDHNGPTVCLRGFENSAYYVLDNDRACFANYTGTGNTLNANQPIVRRMIIDSLHFWVEKMHVDGFRFDLASILSRDESGRPMENPPVLWDIESDPVLAGVKLIAEAWDAAGLYQVGGFIGDNWKEWNGKFRDDVRAFLKGDDGTVPRLAQRLMGSPDIYGHKEREPEQSVNFVTCHDGFTLNDLVSYNCKHNEANGEDNKDGTDYNVSWNCGVEGPTDDSAIEKLRNRQVRNFLTIALTAVGTPMLSMGDEVRLTRRGNNNAYCQDNETNWFDWSLVEKHADICRFTKSLIHYRLSREHGKTTRLMSLNELLHNARFDWHGVKLNQPDWSHDSHSLAVTVWTPGNLVFHIMLNSYREPLDFELPLLSKDGVNPWHRLVDTSLESPDDICLWNKAPRVTGETYSLCPRSIAFLFSHVRERL